VKDQYIFSIKLRREKLSWVRVQWISTRLR